MVEFEISAEHNAARLSATVGFADAGPRPSRIQFFNATEVLLATVVLTKPCGTVQGDVLRLRQAEVSGDMVLVDGEAVLARWVSGADNLVAAGLVTDDTGVGPFILQGTSGTYMFAGGRAILGETEIA